MPPFVTRVQRGGGEFAPVVLRVLVVDHLNPPHEFRVGDKWSRLVLADYLEIVSQQENVRRERAHGMRVG